MDDFIGEDDLQTFDGFLKYQAADVRTPEDREKWQHIFDAAKQRCENSPKLGLMKLQPIPNEQKYAVALQDGSDLWLMLWVRCSHKGEIFIMYPSGNRDWNPHASYHLDGTLHQKSFSTVYDRTKRQPLTQRLSKSEHLGFYRGHSRNSGAVCNPTAFDGVVVVEPGILGPRQGSVGIDLVEPGYETTWDKNDVEQRFYINDVYLRRVFTRQNRPSVVITILQ